MKVISNKYVKRQVLIVASLFVLTSNVLVAKEKLAPEQIEGVDRVSAEGVIELIEKIDNLMIIDSRIKGDRDKGYIESSISLPDKNTNCNSLIKIIPSYDYPVMFYCNGIKCGRSVVAINVAKECGFTQLYWFRGGFEEWVKKGFPFITQQ